MNTRIYHNLISYIDRFADGDYGEWSNPKEKDTSETQYILPYFIHSNKTIAFVKEIYRVSKELGIKNYKDVMKKNGIDCKFEDIDFSKLNSEGIIAILLFVVRGDRFVEGMLEGWLESGRINKLLEKLKELEE